MHCISEKLLDGRVLEGEELMQFHKEIKSEIVQVFERHNLTIGQAYEFLSDCQRDLSAAAFTCSLSEALPRLTNILQQSI